ncbi:MAG: TIGR03617 family F420-dependent LLM class oxidoreductase [Nitrososphaerota archaeon]|nr:TIGR03617 family F420-dependent LLM class oxidoreductase [Nitrososphaerota archaeon]MDG7027030.1 TIGR03617 family F420-dependent LLM class oxidoreductase [Nitrososphaerota archaeon]MDG7030356.1 TIGR03617 family F420-dependent LLM class oxidoreductase [Nitrososphaerota archaeon]
MKIDAEVQVGAPVEAAELSKKAEEYGFDCFWVNETKHDPFVQLSLAAQSTRRISLGTSIALAFTRSPTTLAYTAWDLQSLSAGRLILGLGSQVKGHIERRFGMKWDAPAPKMRDEVLAMKAVWESWQEGKTLGYHGRYFRLDLMTPFFSPGPVEHPEIPIYVAGVNPGMCRVAGEVAEGLHVHPLHTVRYLTEVVRPALEAGAAKAGRKGRAAAAASVFAAVGETREEIRNVREAYREQISFYASTRSYRRVMELHGWGDVCDRLHGLSTKGDWGRMPSEVTDDILNEFVVEGTWDDIGVAVKGRYENLLERVRLYLPFDGNENWKRMIEGFRA